MPANQLISQIDSIRRRLRVLSVAYGIGIVIAGAVGLLIGVILLDYLLNLHSIPRLLALLVALGAIGYLAYRFVGKPATTPITESDIAGKLENAFPEFDDRLRSTVSFINGGGSGSAVFQQRVIDQASTLAGQMKLGSVVVAKPAIQSLAGGVAAFIITILLAFIILDSGTRSIILSRILNPFNAMDWPKRVQINLTSKVPARIPVGQKLELAMKLDRGDKASMKPILYYQIEGSPRQQVFMTRGPDGQYRASMDARLEQSATTGTLKAYIEAGDDRVDLSSIGIVQRLSIKQIFAQVSPPAYVKKQEIISHDLSQAPAVMAEGSNITLSIQFNKQLSNELPTIEPIDEKLKLPAEIKWQQSDPSKSLASFRAMSSLRFRVRATDIDGFSNTALEEYELVVHPDTNLSIQLEKPTRSEERTASSFVPLQAVAEDDCGVEYVNLVINRIQPSPQKWEIPLVKESSPQTDIGWQPVDSAPNRVRNRLNYQWELAPLNLNAGDVIEYQLVAGDNYMLDGKRHEPVATNKLRITIISQEDLTSRVTDEMRGIKSQASLVRQGQVRNNQETKSLADDTKAKEVLDQTDKKVAERLSNQQSSTASSTKQLSSRLQNSIDRLNENRSENNELKEIAENTKDALERTAEGPMKDAGAQLTSAASEKQNRQQHNKTMETAQENQKKALDELDRAIAKMDNIGTLQSAISELSAILGEQKELRKTNEELSKTNLGKKPEQMSAEDRKKLEDNAIKQNNLSEKTQKAIDKLNKQGKQMEKSDPSASSALKSAASKGQESKVSQSQQKAASETKENKQASAQQQQQQAELGLQTMLSELKEAQRKELARLREHLAKLQEQVAILVRRQAGHNLDDVLLQGDEKLKSLEETVLTQLKELSERKPEAIKAPEMRQLVSGQELTERNSRDIGKQADAEPQTAEVGSMLTRAAGKMERAVVSLRAANLPEAYDPSQVEALATLVEAKSLVDQQKRDADNKAAEQQKEAIRARYVKIREQQSKVNTDTIRVEKSRDDKGAIPRTEWPTMNNLPKDQLGLAEQVTAIESDLESLGSVVYIWANRDIKNSMDTVKTDLVASKTNVPTQSEQTRIIDQLDAMIDNLSQKPPEKKFESAGGGGGGGAGKKQKKIPTDVELRMLKSLQVAINKGTLRLDAEKDKDAPKILSLGNRQGELRNLLDTVLTKASEGEMKLGAEPDNKDQLPEESGVGEIEKNELEAALLGGDVAEEKVEQDFRLVGTRMARSRQRLAINSDAGKVTQVIQERILSDLDKLIDQAQQRQQQGECSGGQCSSPSEADAAKQAQNQGKKDAKSAGKPANPNTTSNTAGAGSKPHDLKDIVETASEWGAVTPRMRDAVIESKSETLIEQYRKLIEDYYGALSKEGSRRDQP